MNRNDHAAAYIRVSSPKQRAGVGLERQRRAISIYAQEKSMAIVNWVEEASSAYSGAPFAKRHRLHDLIRTCVREGIPLLVHKVDRLVRRVADMRAILAMGVRVISVTEGDDPATLLAEAGVAEVDAENIVRNTRAGQATRSTRATPLTSEQRRRGHLAREANRVLRDQLVLDVLESLPRDATYETIAEELNRRGGRSEQGLVWSVRSVERPIRRVREALGLRVLQSNPDFGRF